MISVDANTLAALRTGKLIPRDFLEVRARNRTDNSEVKEFLWSGVETISQSVVDPLTGATRTETWRGAGHTVSVGVVSRVSNLTITRLNIKLSNVSDRVNDLIRLYDPKYSTVMLFRSFIDPENRTFIAAGRCRFLGAIDFVKFTRPEENSQGEVEVTCKSYIQDLVRSSPAKRSDAFQRVRNSNDTFRKYAATISQREFLWGRS